jgi:hypothetical protein
MFFDNYPEFYRTTKTIASPNRLGGRYKALIENNSNLIKNSRILDIASHDGRWSFSAIVNGAKHVVGIEGRDELVKSSFENMKKYGIPEEKYTFYQGDIIQEITKIKAGTVDIVFCFGFFYHTMHHLFLLSEIKRINPKYLILDTGISQSTQSIIELKEENSEDPRNAISDPMSKSSSVIVGLPSKKAIEDMLTSLGFSFVYYDWHNQIMNQNWTDLEDYKTDLRITLTAKNT